LIFLRNKNRGRAELGKLGLTGITKKTQSLREGECPSSDA